MELNSEKKSRIRLLYIIFNRRIGEEGENDEEKVVTEAKIQKGKNKCLSARVPLMTVRDGRFPAR